jgi:hypothetical protein
MNPNNHAWSGLEASSRLRFVGAAAILLGLLTFTASAAARKPETEPRAFGIYPLGNRPGPAMTHKFAVSSCRTRKRSGSKPMAFRRESITRNAIRNPIQMPRHHRMS